MKREWDMKTLVVDTQCPGTIPALHVMKQTLGHVFYWQRQTAKK